VQTGDTITDAVASTAATRVTESRLVNAGIERTGSYYCAREDDGCLLIQTDRFDDDIAIYTVALRLLGDDHILAAENGGGGHSGQVLRQI